jgi:UV DNA damage endonuclease
MLRLGYACVNTSLPSPARTTRLANATPGRLLELAAANIDALEAILRWNVAHDVRVFRISSGTIPFGGHPVNGVPWEEALAGRFAALAKLARESELRLSTHPGQFVVLGSPDERVVDAARADLEYHARLLTALGLDASHGIVIHVGGVYGDRAAAAARVARAVERLGADARGRLRLEHDERWTLAEVLPVAAAIGAPVVFDRFHHELNPSFAGEHVGDLVRLVGETWLGPQELHFSTQHPGKRPGAHAATLDLDAFEQFSAEVDGIDADCILEVKDKERSVLAARDRLYTGAL